MYLLYSALLAAALLLSLPYWILQMLRHGKYRHGLMQRLGQVPSRLAEHSQQPTIWFHAVSVGEVLAVSGLVDQMRLRWPNFRIVVSTTTDTGQRLAAQPFRRRERLLLSNRPGFCHPTIPGGSPPETRRHCGDRILAEFSAPDEAQRGAHRGSKCTYFRSLLARLQTFTLVAAPRDRERRFVSCPDARRPEAAD